MSDSESSSSYDSDQEWDADDPLGEEKESDDDNNVNNNNATTKSELDDDDDDDDDSDREYSNDLDDDDLHSSNEETPDRRSNRYHRVFMAYLTLFVMIAVIIIIAGAMSWPDDGSEESTAAPPTDDSASNNSEIATFYVIADTFYNEGDRDTMIRDLESLPRGTSDFLVHLGNIQDASVTLCSQQTYIDAKVSLRASPIPVFVVPGPNDWNNCPDPGIAMYDWHYELGNNFARKFFWDLPFSVTEPVVGVKDKFAFVQKQVLFIGLPLVGGRKKHDEEEEWRRNNNVLWVKNQLSNNVTAADTYRAVILFAHARPHPQHYDFFRSILKDINDLKKPVVYIHTHEGEGNFSHYKPFPEESPVFSAIQIQSGGSRPPLQISVSDGTDPIVFSPLHKQTTTPP